MTPSCTQRAERQDLGEAPVDIALPAILARRSSNWAMRLCGVNPSGRLTCASPIAASTLASAAVLDLGSGSSSLTRVRAGAGAAGRVAGGLEDLLQLGLVVAQQLLRLVQR